MKEYLVEYLVEFLGTMLIMYIILAIDNWIAVGIVTSLAIFVGGTISSTAYNPAVAVALHVGGKLSKNDLLLYIISETLGALSALYIYNKYGKLKL